MTNLKMSHTFLLLLLLILFLFFLHHSFYLSQSKQAHFITRIFTGRFHLWRHFWRVYTWFVRRMLFSNKHNRHGNASYVLSFWNPFSVADNTGVSLLISQCQNLNLPAAAWSSLSLCFWQAVPWSCCCHRLRVLQTMCEPVMKPFVSGAFM